MRRPPELAEDMADRIAAMRAYGATLTGIADRPHEEGVSAARGDDHWWPSSVRAVLNRRVA